MNSICKKFKKVISSVVLSCSMVCSGGFANAGLKGTALNAYYLDEFNKTVLNNFKELEGKKSMDQALEKLRLCGIVSLYDQKPINVSKEIASNLMKRFASGEISLRDLIDEGDKLFVEEGNFGNFALACHMVKHLEGMGVGCALAFIRRYDPKPGVSSIKSLGDFDDGLYFGVVTFMAHYNQYDRLMLFPRFKRFEGTWSFSIRDLFEGRDKFAGDAYARYVFVDDTDCRKAKIKARLKASDIVTPDSWLDAAKCIRELGYVYVSLKPISDELFCRLAPLAKKNGPFDSDDMSSDSSDEKEKQDDKAEKEKQDNKAEKEKQDDKEDYNPYSDEFVLAMDRVIYDSIEKGGDLEELTDISKKA